jgi:membrane fusion protein, multidrug efflux system
MRYISALTVIVQLHICSEHYIYGADSMTELSKISRNGRIRRLFVGFAIAGAVIVTGSAAVDRYLFTTGAAAGPAAPEQAVAVTVAVVEPRQTTLWDDFSGRLEAVNRVELRPRVAGAILSANFTEGTLVKAGDVLFKIDPAPYAAEVDKAQAQLEAAKARVVFTAGELERGQQLVGNNIVTRRDFDQRDNANREAIANVKAAEATLQTARLNLDYTEVRAPVDGRVGKIEVTVGNLVAAGTSSPVLTSLVSVNPIYASFDADEDVVLRALNSIADSSGTRDRLGQIPVEMSTSGGSSAKGHIQLIDNQVNGQSGTIRVRAVFKNDDGRLIPGQFARLRMGQPQQQSLVMVDERAIGTDQDKRFVMVVGTDNRAQYRSITLGGAVDGLRIVTSGLKSGDHVVVNGLQRVRPGALVKIEVAAMGAHGEQRASADNNQRVARR